MSKRIWFAAILITTMLLTGCGRGARDAAEDTPVPLGGGEEAPQTFEDTAAAVSTPLTVLDVTVEPTVTAGPTATPEPSRMPAPTATATIADSNPCIRDVFVPPVEMAGGDGEEVIRFDIVESEDSPLVLNKLKQESIVESVHFADADGRLIVTYSGREGIRILDAGSEEEIARPQGDIRLRRPVLSREAGLLAADDGQGKIWLWDLNQIDGDSSIMLVDLGEDEFGRSRVRGIALSPDGRLLAVAEDREITRGEFTAARWGVARVFDTHTGEELGRFEGEMISEAQVPEELEDFGLDFDGALGDLVPAVIQNGHAGPIDWLAFSPDSRLLFTGNLANGHNFNFVENHGTEGTIRIWDLDTGEHVRCLETGDLDDGTDPAISPDGLELAAESKRSIVIWDVAAGEIDRRIALPDVLDLDIGAIIYSPDGGSLIAATGQEKALRIWNSETGRLTGLLRHPEVVNSADVSEDGRRIVTGFGSEVWDDGNYSQSGEAWIWNAGHSSVMLAAQAQALVEEGLETAGQGDIQGMLLAFEEAQNLTPDDGVLLRPAIWEKACRSGSLGGNAGEALAVCERAFAEAIAAGYDGLNLIQYYDSRGLARALTGDYQRAVEDFEFYVGMFDDDGFFVPGHIRWRQEWIEALSSGVNPFDERTLDALRNE